MVQTGTYISKLRPTNCDLSWEITPILRLLPRSILHGPGTNLYESHIQNNWLARVLPIHRKVKIDFLRTPPSSLSGEAGGHLAEDGLARVALLGLRQMSRRQQPGVQQPRAHHTR